MTSNATQGSTLFRQQEITQLFAWLKAGESASIVGISGVGKSNLFNHLLDPAMQRRYLGDDAPHTILLRVNFHYLPDVTERTVFSLILEQLTYFTSNSSLFDSTVQQQLEQYHEALLNAGTDFLKVQYYGKRALHLILAQSKYRLVIICDQFDTLFQEAEEQLFSMLRGLRETYKYRLSYFVFTRDTLATLAIHDSGREEFYELLESNVLGLKPYNNADAWLLLERISNRYRLELDKMKGQQLIDLTGGHAGILRAALLATSQHPQQSPPITLQTLQNSPTVQLECQKIWQSLPIAERRTLFHLANERKNETLPTQIIENLRLKGLLSPLENETLFSPVFSQFVKAQNALWEMIDIDERKRQVWVLGKPITLNEREMKIVRLLHQQLNLVVTKDELIEAGWPHKQGDLTGDALTAAIYRIRKKIEPDDAELPALNNIRGMGYTLVTQ